jgi:hypothetical protein
VPKLKRRPHPRRQSRQKLPQPAHITLEVPRQLKKHRPQLARKSQRFQRSQKFRCSHSGITQSLAMSDPPVRFHRKPKLLGHLRRPPLQQRLAHPTPKRIIHLHRIQPPRIMLQKSPRPDLRRIKSRSPARVSPPRRPRVNLSHTQHILNVHRKAKRTISCAIAPVRSFAAAASSLQVLESCFAGSRCKKIGTP